MPLEPKRMRIVDVADTVDDALARLETRGLRRGRGDRFAKYTKRLRAFGAGPFPVPLPLNNTDDRALFFEAATQCSLLLTALEVEPNVDGATLCEKLKLVLDGAALPPTGVDAVDTPRNYLLELGVGALLQRGGFRLEYAGVQDWTAHLPGLPSIVVECTRPTQPKSLRKGLKHVHRQLKQRADGEAAIGLAVIGFDRVMGITGPSVFRDEGHLRDAVLDASTQAIRRVQEFERLLRPRLFPTTPLAAVALLTGVFLEEAGIVYSVGQLDLFCTGSERDPRAIEVLAMLPSSMEFASMSTRRMLVGPVPAVPLVPTRAINRGSHRGFVTR